VAVAVVLPQQVALHLPQTAVLVVLVLHPQLLEQQ
jgi:hypothetical protein